MRTIYLLCLLLHMMQPASGQKDTAGYLLLDTIGLLAGVDEQDETFPYYSLLSAGRDPFTTAAAFNFNAVRFRMRGYGLDCSETVMNGLLLNNPDNGFTPWYSWSGLTDVTRTTEQVRDLSATDYAFGDMGGAQQIDVGAGRQRPQTTTGYSVGNRSYSHRLNVMHATGFNRKGLARAGAVAVRYAAGGYVPGTFLKSVGYYLSASRKYGDNHIMDIILLGAFTGSGLSSPTTAAAKEAAGTIYYNPAWGYQNGNARNANVAETHQPLLILTHKYRIHNGCVLSGSVGYLQGRRSLSSFDWYHASDPRPDYYRYLPDYQFSVAQQQQVKQAWADDVNVRQINWHRLYEVNRNSIDGVAAYIVQNRVTFTRRYMAAANVLVRCGYWLRLSAGVSWQQQQNSYFKEVADLMGADSYVDINQFAERDFPGDAAARQNNLEHPDRVLTTGDKFGYHYSITTGRQLGWMQAVISSGRWCGFVAGSYVTTSYYRYGFMRNGLFPLDSYGPATRHRFQAASAKLGITLSVNGRQYLYVHAAILQRAPYADDLYLSPRTRNSTQERAVAENVSAAECGYVVNAPSLKIRWNVYGSIFRNGSNILSFYDDIYNSFVNCALSNISRLHYGTELSIDWTVWPDFSLQLCAMAGRYYYQEAQRAVLTMDNDASVLNKTTVYMQGYRPGGTPQEAYSMGFSYRSSAWWSVQLTGCCFRQQWEELNPMRRTPEALDQLSPESAVYRNITRQALLPSQYSVNLFAAYSRKMPWRQLRFPSMAVYMGISNLLNNRGLVTRSYEQLRFDTQDKETALFPSKTQFAMGINCFLSVVFRFQ